MTPTAKITICKYYIKPRKGVNILCPYWPLSESKVSGLPLRNLWTLLILKMQQLDKQNRNLPSILIITEAKNPYFFVCKRTGFVHQELRDFVKMALTRVSSHWQWLESSRVILWNTWRHSSRVTIFFNVTRVESEAPKIVTRVIDLSHAITATCTSQSWWCRLVGDIYTLQHPSTWFFAGKRFFSIDSLKMCLYELSIVQQTLLSSEKNLLLNFQVFFCYEKMSFFSFLAYSETQFCSFCLDGLGNTA